MIKYYNFKDEVLECYKKKPKRPFYPYEKYYFDEKANKKIINQNFDEKKSKTSFLLINAKP